MAKCKKCQSKQAVKLTITLQDGSVIREFLCIRCADKILNGGKTWSRTDTMNYRR